MRDYEVEVLAASQSPFNKFDKVLTLRLQYPRIVLAELNTHRWLSRNTASSRATPVAKMLETVRNDPAMPYRFGANQPGMQDKGGEHNQRLQIPDVLLSTFDRWTSTHFHTGLELEYEKLYCGPRTFWRFMAWVNAAASESYSDAGYHKQVANRLTEPYQWTNTVVSATTQGWIDLLKLRDHEAADPTLAHLAGMIRETRNAVSYTHLEPGEWHLPYILPEEHSMPTKEKLVLSTARLARVSIAPFDGNPQYEKEKARHDLLVESDPPHASPTEHCCVPWEGRHGNFVGFKQYRQFLEERSTI